jgi:hypothetical protein
VYDEVEFACLYALSEDEIELEVDECRQCKYEDYCRE